MARLCKSVYSNLSPIVNKDKLAEGVQKAPTNNSNTPAISYAPIPTPPQSSLSTSGPTNRYIDKDM